MKIKLGIFGLIYLLSLNFVTSKAHAQVSVGFQVFYDELSPYGSWIENPEYGYVWMPDVEAGFVPYGSNGYWVFTESGWTWVSTYPWGWAPFHYGRWYFDPIYGPMWVPGYEWGPGWVCWRRSEGYYGWAPIEPGISISVAYSNNYYAPNSRWVVVRDRDFGTTNTNNYYVNNSNNTTIIKNSTVINNIQIDKSKNVTYNSGPDKKEIEQRVGKPVAPVAIRENTKPGQQLNNNNLEIYRPRIEKESSTSKKAVPPKVTPNKDVKPDRLRTPQIQPEKVQPVQPERKQPEKVQPVQPEQKQPEKVQPVQPERKQPEKVQPVSPQRNPPDKLKPVTPREVKPPVMNPKPIEPRPVKPIKKEKTSEEEPASGDEVPK